MFLFEKVNNFPNSQYLKQQKSRISRHKPLDGVISLGRISYVANLKDLRGAIFNFPTPMLFDMMGRFLDALWVVLSV